MPFNILNETLLLQTCNDKPSPIIQSPTVILHSGFFFFKAIVLNHSTENTNVPKNSDTLFTYCVPLEDYVDSDFLFCILEQHTYDFSLTPSLILLLNNYVYITPPHLLDSDCYGWSYIDGRGTCRLLRMNDMLWPVLTALILSMAIID